MSKTMVITGLGILQISRGWPYRHEQRTELTIETDVVNHLLEGREWWLWLTDLGGTGEGGTSCAKD